MEPNGGGEEQRSPLCPLREGSGFPIRTSGLTSSHDGDAVVSSVARTSMTNPTDKSWECFIAYAGEDRADVVRPLADKLQEAGVKVWFDEWELRVGDSLSRKIDEGLRQSAYGVVVLSPRFFGKGWPERELSGLVQRQTAEGTKLVLPVWHEVDADQVRNCSPPLADLIATSTSRGIGTVAQDLLDAMGLSSSPSSKPAKTDSESPPSTAADQKSYPMVILQMSDLPGSTFDYPFRIENAGSVPALRIRIALNGVEVSQKASLSPYATELHRVRFERIHEARPWTISSFRIDYSDSEGTQYHTFVYCRSDGTGSWWLPTTEFKVFRGDEQLFPPPGNP